MSSFTILKLINYLRSLINITIYNKNYKLTKTNVHINSLIILI